MLHLRVIVPPELTETVSELLVREPGVVHITLAVGAAVDPDGDVSGDPGAARTPGSAPSLLTSR